MVILECMIVCATANLKCAVVCATSALRCAGRFSHLQISNIRIIKEAMREASFLYAELVALGAAMGTIDIGGLWLHTASQLLFRKHPNAFGPPSRADFEFLCFNWVSTQQPRCL